MILIKTHKKARDEFAKEGIELRKKTQLTATQEQEIKFSKDILRQVENADLNIDTLKFDTIKEGTEIDGKVYDSDVIIIRQNIITNK